MVVSFAKIFLLFMCLWSTQAIAQTPPSRISMESKAFNDFVMNPENIPVVKGRILNGTPEYLKKLRVTYQCIFPYVKATEFRNTPVAEDGSFEIPINYAIPFQQIFINITNHCFFQAFITKDLYIEIDLGQMNDNISSFKGQGISFSGTDGELCTFLHRRFWYKKDEDLEQNIALQKAQMNIELPRKELLTIYNQYLQKQTRNDSLFLQTNPSPYGWILENRQSGGHFERILQNAWSDFDSGFDILPAICKTSDKYEGAIVCHDCKGFYSALSSIIYGRAQIIYLPEFCRELLKKPSLPEAQKKLLIQGIETVEYPKDSLHIDRISRLAREIDKYHPDELSLLTIRKCIRLLDSLYPAGKADLIKMNMLLGDKQLQKNIAELLLNNIKTPWCQKLLNDEYQKILAETQREQQALSKIQPLAKDLGPCKAIGQTPFGAYLYKTESTDAKEFLNQLKEVFKGKALLLELWATWCGWCPQHLRLADSHKQQLKDYPVEFLYLCTAGHSSEEKWKTLVAKLNIPGIHIFINTELTEHLKKLLSFSDAVPRAAFFNSGGEYLPDVLPNHSVPMEVDELKKLLEPVK